MGREVYRNRCVEIEERVVIYLSKRHCYDAEVLGVVDGFHCSAMCVLSGRFAIYAELKRFHILQVCKYFG